MKRLFMEFLGTFFLVFAIAMSFNSIAIGAMLMVWVYIGAFVSGAHYNPLVSLAMALRGKLAWDKLPWYWLAQVLGGFVAFAMAYFLHRHVALPTPGVDISLLQAFIMEVLLSFVFALIILVVGTAEKYKGNDIFGFAIGFSIPALAAVGGPVSGGLFNPAIALGSALFAIIMGVSIIWSHIAMYVGGALLGAVLAAYAFHYFIAEKHEEIIIFNFVQK